MEDNFLKTEKIIQHEIHNEMKNSYINYSMSVIVGRALPDVRDGLKPVHRRILCSLCEHRANTLFTAVSIKPSSISPGLFSSILIWKNLLSV